MPSVTERAIALIAKGGAMRSGTLALKLGEDRETIERSLDAACAQGALVSCEVQIIGGAPQKEYRLSATGPRAAAAYGRTPGDARKPPQIPVEPPRSTPQPEGDDTMNSKEKIRKALEDLPAEEAHAVAIAGATKLGYANTWAQLKVMIDAGEAHIAGKIGSRNLYALGRGKGTRAGLKPKRGGVTPKAKPPAKKPRLLRELHPVPAKMQRNAAHSAAPGFICGIFSDGSFRLLRDNGGAVEAFSMSAQETSVVCGFLDKVLAEARA